MNAPPPADENFLIRPYLPRDRAVLREICCRTACRNRSSTLFFSDGELFADYFTCYYTDFEPQSVLVVEREGRVVGYLTGCVDTRRMLRRMAWRILPVLLARLFWRRLRGRYRCPRDRRFLAWLFRRSWHEAPRVPLDRYPAHFHCNLLPEAHNHGLYSRLALQFLEALERAGVTHLHGNLLEPAERGVFQRIVQGYRRQRPDWLAYFHEKPTRFPQEVLEVEERMVNRAYGFSISEYRGFLTWMASRYRL